MAEKKNENFEKDLILSITKALMNVQSSQSLVMTLNSIFKEKMGIDAVNFCMVDYTTGRFKDFVRDWLYVEDQDKHIYLSNIFQQIQTSPNSFILNGRLSSFISSEDEIKEMKAVLNHENNLIYFPIVTEFSAIGIIEFYFRKLDDKVKINQSFLQMLQIVLMEISTAISNYITRSGMATNLNFYDAMKNMAKIIENQYELTYIMPQIGEMIDRFISSQLIYIFFKNANNKYELVWPTNCNNDEVLSLLDQLKADDDVIFSEDRQTSVFPLMNDKELVGAIVASSSIGMLSPSELEYLIELTKQASVTIQRANAYSEILKHATLDALTGLNNRRQFEVRIKQETSQSTRKSTPLCGIMLDIDYFKKINDTYGHAAGDCVLKGLSQIIIKTFREYDIPCRYGGEEFFIILPMTPLDEAVLVAQRLRRIIQETPIDIREAKVKGVSSLYITASMGVNIYKPGETPEEFYGGADKALYEAKINGRNKVVSFRKSSDVVFAPKDKAVISAKVPSKADKKAENVKEQKPAKAKENKTTKTAKKTSTTKTKTTSSKKAKK